MEISAITAVNLRYGTGDVMFDNNLICLCASLSQDPDNESP